MIDYFRLLSQTVFLIRTKPQAQASGVFDMWHVAFHGTRFESLAKILETGDLLLPGMKLILYFGWLKPLVGAVAARYVLLRSIRN